METVRRRLFLWVAYVRKPAPSATVPAQISRTNPCVIFGPREDSARRTRIICGQIADYLVAVTVVSFLLIFVDHHLLRYWVSEISVAQDS